MTSRLRRLRGERADLTEGGDKGARHFLLTDTINSLRTEKGCRYIITVLMSAFGRGGKSKVTKGIMCVGVDKNELDLTT